MANTLQVTSPAFNDGQMIPSRYTCDGQNINPGLQIDGLPEGTKTLTLIVDDPDAPRGTWTHWVVWNITPSDAIEENSIPGEQGSNDFGRLNYGGPCPPSGVHRYYFKVYALDTTLQLHAGATKEQLLDAMNRHILAEGQLMGRYKRN